MDYVLTEADIFKYVILNQIEDNPEQATVNSKKMVNRIPINIFEGTYQVLYDAIMETSKFSIALDYDIYHQILVRNKSNLVTNPNLDFEISASLSEQEKANQIVDICLAEFDELTELEVQGEEYFLANMEFYLQTWCKEKSIEIYHKMIKITESYEYINNVKYQGVEDADTYYRSAFLKIKQLLGDEEGLISNSINTQDETYEEVKERTEEESLTEIVSYTGIDEIDEHNKFRKGEIVTIQAGTGVGKTKFANNMVYNTLSLGKNVLYLSLEQKAERIIPMQYARHILEMGHDLPNVTDKEILFKTYDYNLESTIDSCSEDLFTNDRIGRLKIDSVAVNALEIKDYLLRVWEQEKFHFDVVVVDYFGLLECKDRYKDLTYAMNTFKSECKSFKGEGFLAILPNQLDKESEKALAEGRMSGLETKTAGSETSYASRGADYVFTLEQNIAMKRNSKMKIHVGKIRSGDVIHSEIFANSDLGRVKFTSSGIEVNEYDDWD